MNDTRNPYIESSLLRLIFRWVDNKVNSCSNTIIKTQNLWVLLTVLQVATPSELKAQSLLQNLFGQEQHNFGTRHEMVTEVFSCYERKILRDVNFLRTMDGSGVSLGITRDLPELLSAIMRINGERGAIDNTRDVVGRMTSDLWDSVVNDGEDFYERVWVEKNSMVMPKDDNQHFEFYLLNTVMDCSLGYFEKRK